MIDRDLSTTKHPTPSPLTVRSMRRFVFSRFQSFHGVLRGTHRVFRWCNGRLWRVEVDVAKSPGEWQVRRRRRGAADRLVRNRLVRLIAAVYGVASMFDMHVMACTCTCFKFSQLESIGLAAAAGCLPLRNIMFGMGQIEKALGEVDCESTRDHQYSKVGILANWGKELSVVAVPCKPGKF